MAPPSRPVTWCFLVTFLLSLGAEAAHPPRRTGPCSWSIDTSLRPNGVLHTPNFPGRFQVPANCKWILNVSNSPNSYIVVWFTQLYVLNGLKITEFVTFEDDELGGHGSQVLLDSAIHAQLLNYTWVRSRMPFLVIELHLEQLEGNHVRTRDNLLDVFGFNITYELMPKDVEPSAFPRRCSVVECSYTGDCTADATLENYVCICYDGFSGDNCEFGPLCNTHINPCFNGGICRHMTADAVLCTCNDTRFYGPLCEFSNVTECEQGGQCEAQCPYEGRSNEVCNCGLGPSIPPDRARYETTIGLVNVSRSSSSIARDLPAAVAAAVNPATANPRPLESHLESKLLKFLRGWNLTRVEDVKILRISTGASFTFSFFSGKADREELVLPALNALVRRQRIGPFELKAVLEFKKEPALYLESVRVNRERVLHEGDEFILSCLAQGSIAMEFRWFKDGYPVNDSLSIRDMEQSLLNRDSRDMYTALLRISSAVKQDEGNFTCQVVDRGVQQCKSIYIEVASPPSVTISPMTVTLTKGDNLTIFCMSSNEKRSEKFGFNWTKNNALLPASAGREVMEDLYPDGLLLRIYNAHQSATYACNVQGGGGSSSAKVEVAITTGSVPLCRAETLHGVHWSHTAPGQEARQLCPVSAVPTPRSAPVVLRAARRMCSLYDTGVARWHQPDFSECISHQLEVIHNKFRLLQLGYAATTPEQTLRTLLVLLGSRKSLLPGEGEPVLALLQDVHEFLRKRSRERAHPEVVATSRASCQALNVLLEHRGSLVKSEKVAELQQLMLKQALLWGTHLGAPTSAHLDLSAVLLDVARLPSTGVYLRFPLGRFEYPTWLSDKLIVRIQTLNSSLPGQKQRDFGNGNVTLAMIVYRNLSSFLSERYVVRKKDGDAVELELNSRVVSVAAVKGGSYTLAEESTAGLVEVELELARRSEASGIVASNGRHWNATCAAARGTSWNLESSCRVLTTPGTDNVTKCRCMGTGTFAALLTMHAPTQAARKSGHKQVAVALGCACCLALSSASMLLLAVHLWLHRSCLTFLKLQVCATVAGAMLVFVCTACAAIPQGWYPAATSALEAFLLVALSSPLSTLMLVYTEVVQMRPAGGVVALKHLRHTVVSTITGLPVLAVFCSHLAHSSTGVSHSTLGLKAGSPRFIIFVASALFMAAIFMVVHSGATRRLHVLQAQNSGKNKAISRRISLLKRATAIFSCLVCVVVAALFYINIPSTTYQYIFSISCVILGVVLLVCLAILSETPLRIKDMMKIKEKQKAEGTTEFSSESLDSPLRLFLRPDVTRGNESANPGLVAEMDEVMATTAPSPPEEEDRELLPVRPRDSSPQPVPVQQQVSLPAGGTAETYVQPAGDIERYDSSPKKYQQDSVTPRPQPGRCFIEDPNGGVIVQACVEPEPISDSTSWLPPPCGSVPGYVNMSTGKCTDSSCVKRAIPVPPPCVPDLTYIPSLSKSSSSKLMCAEPNVLINTSSSNSSSGILTNKNTIMLACTNVPATVYCSSALCDENVCSSSSKKSSGSMPRVTFSGCDTVVEVDEPPPTPPPPPSADVIPTSSKCYQEAAEARKQPEGREMPIADDNVEGMLDRISHDLDYLLSRKSDTLPQPALRSALASSSIKKTNKTDLKVKIKEQGNIIYINSPTHSYNDACDSSDHQ